MSRTYLLRYKLKMQEIRKDLNEKPSQITFCLKIKSFSLSPSLFEKERESQNHCALATIQYITVKSYHIAF